MQKARDEQIRVQVILVWFAGQFTESFQFGKPLDRNDVRHLEAEPEIGRNLLNEAIEIFLGWKGVLSSLHTHGLEDLRVLGNTLAVEAGLVELAAILVTQAVIKRPAPSGILPGGGADENPCASQPRQAFPQTFPFKLHPESIAFTVTIGKWNASSEPRRNARLTLPRTHRGLP
jgi:hypothetical protein